MAKKKNKRAKKPEHQSPIVQPPKNRLILPGTRLITPLSPHGRRMANLVFPVSRPGTPEASRLQQLMDMDIEFQLRLKNLQERLPHLVNARMKGGSGFQLSKLFRWYFLEYLNRFFEHGPESFPTSFNVVESFMSFNREYMFFDLRNEVEHLLGINDYFRWYDSSAIPKEPRILKDILTEGIIYSYEMVSDSGSLRISGKSQQVFSGVSFVRHDYELSCLLLAGENPPFQSDAEASDVELGTATHGREGLVADPALTIQDRYLDGYPSFAKVIVLTRFDLRDGKHDVRYVNLDNGRSFTVLTDDTSIFEDMSWEEIEMYRKPAFDALSRYDDLFAALTSMIYLPAFFVDHASSVQELDVFTELHAMRDDREVQRTIKALGKSEYVTRRRIHCLPVMLGNEKEPQTRISPPEMEFKCDGYWKAISPQAIGEDKNGDPIVGRTWVSRHESWSARTPQSFFLNCEEEETSGPDPGVVYIQRCAAHAVNVYKIGLTRKSADARAGELSSATGVPLPFDVLATWKVSDCAYVERKVHEKLASFRVNPRREFFHADLSHISRTIEAIIAGL